MSTTTTTIVPKLKVIINDMFPGDIFSEVPHYRFVKQADTKGYEFIHLESGDSVFLTDKYITDLLTTADQYISEVRVGREDKLWTVKQITEEQTKGIVIDRRVGDIRVKGIRTLFEEIYNSEVFSCMFTKQDKPLSAKRLAELRSAQINTALEAIKVAQTGKKGVMAEANIQLQNLQNNTILPYEVGEDRELRGFKIQFTSRDGRYDCIDMDIDTSKGETNVRPVNINTLRWLVYKGTKYIVE